MQKYESFYYSPCSIFLFFCLFGEICGFLLMDEMFRLYFIVSAFGNLEAKTDFE